MTTQVGHIEFGVLEGANYVMRSPQQGTKTIHKNAVQSFSIIPELEGSEIGPYKVIKVL